MAKKENFNKDSEEPQEPKTGVEKVKASAETSTGAEEKDGETEGKRSEAPEVENTAADNESSSDKAPETKSGIKWITYGVLLIAIVLFIFYVLADRHTPYTDQARFNGLVIPIAPRVSGYLTDIRVSLHSKVEMGDTLFQLDQRPFLLAIEKAEADLDNTAQTVNAKTASVKSSAGRLGVARAQLDRAQRNYDRVMKVLEEDPGALSLYDRDQAETSLSQATEQVSSAEADLERSQESLGITGPENPAFRAAVKALEQAQLDFVFSTWIAETSGIIESFYVDLGFYSQAGQPIATFISNTDVWIQANMKENNISNLKLGDNVELALDVVPGKVFNGKVRSIGYGVTSGQTNRGDLPEVTGTSGWLRDPQRFPVIITFNNRDLIKYARIGGQVDVVAYTGDYKLLNTLARWRIRLNSWFSYVR